MRQNLVKHLKLHLRLEKRAKEEAGQAAAAVPPPITPINPPVDTTKVEAQKMGYQGRNSIAFKMARKLLRKWSRNGILKKNICPN